MMLSLVRAQSMISFRNNGMKRVQQRPMVASPSTWHGTLGAGSLHPQAARPTKQAGFDRLIYPVADSHPR